MLKDYSKLMTDSNISFSMMTDCLPLFDILIKAFLMTDGHLEFSLNLYKSFTKSKRYYIFHVID